MKFITFNTFYKQNSEFNHLIEHLLEDYFSPENIEDDKYLPIGAYNKNLAKKYSSESDLQSEILFENDNSFFDDKNIPKSLSGYEKSVALRLIYGNMINYIISGPMGSGKTSSMDFILRKLKNHTIGDNSIFLKLDFNENYNTDKIDGLMELFLSDMYSKLKMEIIKTISKFKIADEFLIHSEKDTKFAKFYNLYFNNIYKKNDEWENFEEKEKIFTIFEFIESNYQRMEMKVDLVMRFLNYLGKFIKKRNGIVLVFYDNIDKLPPVAQILILNKIFSYNRIAEIKTMIATRRSTKAKMDKSIRRQPFYFSNNRSQIVYGHIYHHGPSPRKVYLDKLKDLKNNINNISLFKTLSSEYKNIISNRAKELIMELSNRNSNFSEGIYCVAGESKRLGLTLVQRNFCNHIWEFDKKAPNSNEICRSLYIGNNKHNMMLYDDKYIANIFSNSEMEFTLINYILFKLIKIENSKKTASYFYNFLFENFEYSDIEIIDAFNYLLNDKRALIGGEYFPGYKNSDELMRVDDILRVTELGDRYFSNLYEKGVIYTQSCLFSLKWELGSDIPRKESIVKRAKLMREILNEIKDIENYRFDLYKYNIEFSEVKNYNLNSVTIHLTKLHYERFFKIINGFPETNQYANEELQNWIEMVEFWSYNEQIKEKTNYFEVLLKDMKSLFIY